MHLLANRRFNYICTYSDLYPLNNWQKLLSTHELVNDEVWTLYMPVLKISLVTNPELFTLTLMLRAGLDLMIMQNVYLSTLGENLLTHNSPLTQPSFTREKWNMDEIFDLSSIYHNLHPTQRFF